MPGCDANVVPAEGRRKRLLIADMDSTIIGVECIDELADFAGLKAEVAAITEAAMRGELDFEAALIARVALLRGLPARGARGVLRRAGAAQSRARARWSRTMAALGAETALVSGGFSFFSERVAQAAGFARHQANTLLVADGVLTGEVGAADPRAAGQARGAAGAGRRGRGAGRGGAGGRGRGQRRATWCGRPGSGSPTTPSRRWRRWRMRGIEHSDLTALLALQGIPEAEWRS